MKPVIRKIRDLLNRNKFTPVDANLIEEYNQIRSKDKHHQFCHASFKSMTFLQSGTITSCFYNKQYPLGKYPETSIHDAWFGEKIETQREFIRNKDLSHGCRDCSKALHDKSFYSVGAWKYDYLPEPDSKYPVSLDFQISNICNLECVMCNGEYSTSIRQSRENGSAYKSPYDSEFVNQLDEFIPHLKEAAFTGGETFVIQKYFDIWEKMSRINPDIRISTATNASILNDKVKSILNKLKFNFTVSVDSIVDSTYTEIRKLGNLKEVMDNIDYLIEYTRANNTSFTLKICPMRQNWRELPDFLKYWNDREVTVIFNTVLFPSYCALWNLRAVELEEIIAFLVKYQFPEGSETQKANHGRYKNLINQISTWHQEALSREEKGYTSTKSITDLKEILNLNIEEYILNEQALTDEEKKADIEKYHSIADQMFTYVEEEDKLRNALIYMIGYPVDRLVAEMEARTLEKFKQRVRQAAEFDIHSGYEAVQ